MPKITIEYNELEMAELDDLLYAGAYKSTVKFTLNQLRYKLKHGALSDEAAKALESLHKDIIEHLNDEVPSGVELVMR